MQIIETVKRKRTYVASKLEQFHEDRRGAGKAAEVTGLFVFGLIIYLVYSYVYPWWSTTITPALGFAGSFASALSVIILFMAVGYGLIKYGKGHKGLPS